MKQERKEETKDSDLSGLMAYERILNSVGCYRQQHYQFEKAAQAEFNKLTGAE